MALDTLHYPLFVPQVHEAIVTAGDQRVSDEANCEESHEDVLQVVVLYLLLGELLLLNLVCYKSHAVFRDVGLVELGIASTNIGISLGNREFAHLILKVGAVELPEAHVLDACCHKVACAPREEVNVLDLERK